MSDRRKSRILVVDDEAAVLMTYRLVLERQGYDVVACLTWRDAIAAIDGQDFDSVLCDDALEERHTGVEVICAARRRDAGLPSVLLADYATQETADQAASQNIGIMYKPIAIEEFLDTTSRMANGSYEPSQEDGKKDGLRAPRRSANGAAGGADARKG